MGNQMRIVVPEKFQRWTLGARTLAGGFRGVGGPLWHLANEQFFSYTQEYVHVVSGDLKRSGREEVGLEGARVVATVEYGNEEVPYAQIEIDRGGDHDFMGRAWEASQPIFEDIFGASWNRVVSSWG
jgi:hypothetical protein